MLTPCGDWPANYCPKQNEFMLSDLLRIGLLNDYKDELFMGEAVCTEFVCVVNPTPQVAD